MNSLYVPAKEVAKGSDAVFFSTMTVFNVARGLAY